MPRSIPGLHHVTAICGPPQVNVDFYAGVLRQRLVKKTVNFDAPDTYHLYYGDRAASPGTILTFFPFADAGPGRAGPGMASAVAYAAPDGGVDGWMDQFAEQAVEFDPGERFGARMLGLRDPDGLRIELIETDAPSGSGFHSVTLWLRDPEPTARLLTDLFGYRHAGEETDAIGHRQRLVSPGGGPGSAIDLLRSDAPSIGRQGAGTIHHVAFRAETDAVQVEWRERALAFGLDVTPVIDRQYFNAIYFREPGGVLFEIATDPPGFAIDEDAAELGTHLMLPPQHERRRANLERVLPPLRVPA
ncbi:MAG: ring-cleaving dioxygenase [Gemmatimonadaceae bacterium]|nr:ring-cleaving dioxygenase [Acetobacteraceae bacterium]